MNGRYNIGLLVATITDVFSNSIAKGAMRAAKELGVDLTIFPGKYMGIDRDRLDPDAIYEYQYNVLFDIAAEAKLDYLIVAAGTIAYPYDEQRKREFLDKFKGTPTLCVAADIQGYDCLVFDNRTGIAEAVDYLAAQGKKHIGIMAGDPNSGDCIERCQAYREGLERNGLTYDERYFMNCDVSENCHDEALQLIDRCPELDAVVCINDMVATVVYQALMERDRRIGTEVAVVGFDDLPLAAEMTPPLASVRADAVQMGRTSVEIAVNKLRGITDDRKYIPTRFIPRQSSCAGADLFSSLDRMFTGTQPQIRERLCSYISGAELEPGSAEQFGSYVLSLFDRICSDFLNTSPDDDAVQGAVSEINRILYEQCMTGREIMQLLEYTDTLYKWALENTAPELRKYVFRLHDHLYKKLGLYLAGGHKQIENRYQQRTHVCNIFIRDTMMTDDSSLSESYARIMHRLCDVGANTGYLYLFDEPVIHRDGEDFPKDMDWNFKSYNYGSSVHVVPKEEQRRKAPAVFNNGYLAAERQHTFVAADLFSLEYQYGLALLEPADESFFEVLELATYQLSMAVRHLRYAAQARESLRRQDKLLDELNSRSLALEELTKVDDLTGVYNRRGFYLAANELISTDPAGRFLVCYADMDKLKAVNDGYGHNEGDSCIRLVARCLEHALGEGAVIGRMGGDEFAALLAVPDGADISQVTARKEEFVSRQQRTGNRPYRFDISMGVLECECRSSYDLKTAIDKADGLLYAEKSRKRK